MAMIAGYKDHCTSMHFAEICTVQNNAEPTEYVAAVTGWQQYARKGKHEQTVLK